MPRNNNGKYNLPTGNPVVPGTTIETSWANSTMEDVASALTNSIANDGQTDPINNLPMAGYRHTGVSDPTLRNQYTTLGMVQDSRQNRLTAVTGVNNITGALVGGSTSYVAGQLVGFFATANNTGACTLSYNNNSAAGLVSSSETTLVADDLVAGNLYLAYYDGFKWVLITQVAGGTGAGAAQSATSGWIRPQDGTYPDLIIATPTSITVPAGSGVIVSPSGETSSSVMWAEQTVDLSFLASAVTTIITINGAGLVVQVADALLESTYRTSIVIGAVSHPDGTALAVRPRAAIFADDGYLGKDVATAVAGRVTSGARVTAQGPTLGLSVAAGTAIQIGGSPNDDDAPNNAVILGGTGITMYTMYGDGVVGGPVTSIPVAQYDLSGVLTDLPANSNCATHRLYWLNGQYFFVYGQSFVDNVELAISNIVYTRSLFVPPRQMADGVLLAEICAEKNTTSLQDTGKSAIISGGGFTSYIGSSAGIGEAPLDGNLYGRENATWALAVGGISPTIEDSLTVHKSDSPIVTLQADNGTALQPEINVKQSAFNWVGQEYSVADDKAYFRSYNPLDGVLRNSAVWDLATGVWNFPAGLQSDGIALGDVTGPAVAVDNEIALFDGTTGKLLKSGVVQGTMAGVDAQTTTTDDTIGSGLLVGGFGIGTTEAFQTPAGTELQRPAVGVDGMFRYNVDTHSPEIFIDGSWTAMAVATSVYPRNYISGFSVSNNVANPTNAIDISSGSCTNLLNTTSIDEDAVPSKNIAAVWTEGGTPAAPLGGMPNGLPLVNDTWYAVHVIWKADGTVDSGFDISPLATNLLADPNVVAADYIYYRRVGWVRYGTGTILGVKQNGDRTVLDTYTQVTATVSTGVASTLAVQLPPNTLAELSVYVVVESGDFDIKNLRITDTTQPDLSPDDDRSTISARRNATTNLSTSQTVFVKLDDASQLNQRGNTGMTSLSVTAIAWHDPRDA